MAAQILQINFRFSASRAEHEALIASLCESLRRGSRVHLEGLAHERSASEAGGIYLFAVGLHDSQVRHP
jgi:hypothetical protein